MSRIIEITVPPDETDGLASRLLAVVGVVGLSLQRGVALKPPGDVIIVHASNEGQERALRILDSRGVGRTHGSVVTSEPRSILSATAEDALDRETNEMVWQEMAYQLRQETNISANFLLIMFFAGAVAAAGLWTDTVHIVIGAMVIAPGFEPIIRVPFGLMGHSGHSARLGLAATLAGYGALASGAAAALLVLQLLDPESRSLAELPWVRYWSQVQPASVLIALLAGAAGAVVIAAGRSVLTAGVMIALALIPAMAIAGMALADGDLSLAARGALRWSVDAACVAGAGGATFALKMLAQHRGPS